MRFIVDESTGTAVAKYLRDAGHDVLSVAETMPQAEDEDILHRAVAETRVLLTNDKDFGEHIFRSAQPHVGIVLFRLHDESAANRLRVVRALLERHREKLEQHITVVTDSGVRIRPSRIR